MIRTLIRIIFRFFHPIRIPQGNTYANHSKVGKRFYMDVRGQNNTIAIGRDCLLSNTQIEISGENNRLIVEDKVRFIGPCKIIMLGDSTLHIKWNAGIRGVEFNLSGGKIEIGELCMFSYGITLRNHDSHRIISLETKEILNPTKDIILGNHVWIAQNVTILKGCHIGDNSVIGFGSIVTKSCNSGCIMTGVPAKVVKEGITWDY